MICQTLSMARGKYSVDFFAWDRCFTTDTITSSIVRCSIVVQVVTIVAGLEAAAAAAAAAAVAAAAAAAAV